MFTMFVILYSNIDALVLSVLGQVGLFCGTLFGLLLLLNFIRTILFM
jgi:hypothetical protein